MVTFSAVCLFCEDIRQELSGQDTIVGTLPDNLQIEVPPPPVPNARAMLPRIGIYLRINFKADADKPSTASAKVLNISGNIISESEWTSSVIDKAFADAKTRQLPVVGLLFKVVAGPIPITAVGGKITAIVTIDGADHIV